MSYGIVFRIYLFFDGRRQILFPPHIRSIVKKPSLRSLGKRTFYCMFLFLQPCHWNVWCKLWQKIRNFNPTRTLIMIHSDTQTSAKIKTITNSTYFCVTILFIILFDIVNELRSRFRLHGKLVPVTVISDGDDQSIFAFGWVK